jgi:putative copper resistance protein D
MSPLPPLTAARFFDTWRLDLPTAIAILLVGGGYLLLVRAARRRGSRWPAWRVASFLGLGGGLTVLATMSSLGSYEHVLLWPAAVQLTLLLTMVPLAIGMGDPIGLARAAAGPVTARRIDRVLQSRPVRVLAFPAVGAVLAAVTQFVVFFSGYLPAAMRTETLLHVLQLQVVVTGCLFALPLLGVELLPAWCTQPVRLAFAGLDGLLDAVPGIAVISASAGIAGNYYATARPAWAGAALHDQWVAGGMMITVSEVVALPFIAVLFRAWIREDAAAARVIDHRLDLRSVAADGVDDDPHRPWWETDPGPLADRAARYGWTGTEREPRQE